MIVTNEKDETAVVKAPRGKIRKAGVLGAATTLAGGSALAMMTALAGSASAATFTVDQATDDGSGTVSGTLSWAIAQAELDDAADVIDFSPSLTTITFSGDPSQVPITNSLSITGPGSGLLTIDLNNNCHLAAVLDSDADLRVSGITIENGNVSTSSATQGCAETGDHYEGGGLVVLYGGADTSVTISDVTFQNNSAYYYGGGFSCNGTAQVTIENSLFDGNENVEGDGGGAYLNCELSLTISGSTFSNNTALEGTGGGVLVRTDNGVGSLIVNSTFSGNTASNGGGIGVGNGNSVVLNSTISGNTAGDGGGLYGDSPISLIQSTVTGNEASFDGGGMNWKLGTFGNTFTTFDILMSTISGNAANTGNELHVEQINSSYQDASIVGSVIAGTGAGDAVSVAAAFQADPADFPVKVSYSVLGAVSGPPLIDVEGNTLDVTDPMLEELADNGGPTMTMLPLDGSPVIDAGPPTVPVYSGNEFDQRGTPYARTYNGTVDVGAVETQPGPTPPTSSTTTTTSPAPSTTIAPDPEPEDSDPVVPAFAG
ncbi:unannotated protein [freshwater metagenome]|uniref:Unannotated protein n=1 Tax=freshwater metagenome TaxID=449393 RepID=A0A6J6I3P6_9ZZZZ